MESPTRATTELYISFFLPFVFLSGEAFRTASDTPNTLVRTNYVVLNIAEMIFDTARSIPMIGQGIDHRVAAFVLFSKAAQGIGPSGCAISLFLKGIFFVRYRSPSSEGPRKNMVNP